MDTALKAKIEQILSDNPILLVMKGDADAPACGFSARAVQLMNQVGQPYATLNIFEHDDLRSGLKEFSNWPTFPQLYVKGQLVGGVDIMTEMYEEGDLHEALGAKLAS